MNGSEDGFAFNLQILLWKIIAWKPSFWPDTNEQLKHHYEHKLWDSYYVAIAHRALQVSDNMESFTQFCGHLAMTFSDKSKSGKTSSHVSTVEVSSSTILEEPGEPKLSTNS